MTIHSESSVVLILGDYAHFQESMLVKALDFASIRHTDEPNSNETLAMFWNPWCRLNLESIVPSGYTLQVINGGGFNDSKKNVASVFEEVFGYELTVEPTQFDGEIVRKSDANATHDGVVLKGPIDESEVLESCTYQKLINNRMGPSVIDIRVSIVTQVRKQCYVKLRPIADRFSNENAKAWLAPTDIFLDSSEIALVNEFCQRIKLDFGQLDLCRDNISNRLYIVDANNTPFGPANGMAKDDSIAAITELAVDFVSEFGLNAVGLN